MFHTGVRVAASENVTREARANTAGGMNWVVSWSSCAGSALWRSLATRSASCVSRRRSTGSAIVREQRHAHHPNPVPEGPPLLLGPHRHGHLRDERLIRQLLVLDQPSTDRAGADRHYDVVDRAAVRVLDRLDLVERQSAERESPMGGDARPLNDVRGRVSDVRSSTRDSRRRSARVTRAVVLPNSLAPGISLISGASSRLGSVDGSAWTTRPRYLGAPSRPHGRASRGRSAPCRAVRPSGGGGSRPFGRQVEQHAEDLGSGHAVDGGVVDLRQQGNAIALQPVDQIHLPQRPPPGRAAGQRSAPPAPPAYLVAVGGSAGASSRTWYSRSKSGSSIQYG